MRTLPNRDRATTPRLRQIHFRLVQGGLPHRVPSIAQMNAVGGEVRSQIAITGGEVRVDVEIVGSLTFGNDGKPAVQRLDAIVGDLGRSGGENRLEDDLGLGVLLAKLLEGLRNIAKNIRASDSSFQIIYTRHDINRVGMCSGKVRRSPQHLARRFPGYSLVQPYRRSRKTIARKPQT